jgi:hypothetical protein
MSFPATNPTLDASANPTPGADSSDFGSRPNIDHNTMVYVPHPGLDDGDEQPGGPEPQPQAAPRRAPERATANRQGEGGQEQTQPQPSGDGDQAQPFKVIKYKGREVAIDSEDKYHELASQGLDYTVKTQMLAPYLNDLKSLARLRSTPEGAARLEAILRGEEPGAIPGGQAGGAGRLPGQGGGQPAPAKLPEIYVRDPNGNVVYGDDGQPVKADPTFVHAVRDMLQAMGYDQPGQEGQGRGQAPGIPPELAPLVTERQVARVEAYVKQSFNRDDFRSAIPAIQETMLARGIVPGDPRDNPDTWLNIYTHLALTGGIPAPAGGQASGGAGDPPPSVRRPNKSAAKEAGQVPTHQMNQPPGHDLDKAIARAKEHGRSSDWQEVVGLVVDHPALHME